MLSADLGSSFFTCLQILVATALFALSLPLREKPAGRLAVLAVVVVAWAGALSVFVPLSMPGSGQSWILLVVFGCSLLASLFAVVFIFDASVWTGFFCCTAGYTLQNLASGIGNLVGQVVPQISNVGAAFNMVVPFAVVYGLCWGLLIKRIRRQGLALIEQHVMLIMMPVVIFAIIGFDVVVKELAEGGVPFSLCLACRLVHCLLCVGVLLFEYEALYSKRAELEAATLEQIMADERTQYQVSRDTIEAINVKCHDIKHMIRDLGEASELPPGVVDEMTEAVKVYDSGIRTGNEALDVLLSEKSLACAREGITLSCIADGAALAFMKPTDLYSLVLNALDNAIEAVRAIDESDHRSISLVVRRTGDTAVVHVENYFAGQVAFGADGLPRTTKKDQVNHGFGMRSMQLVAERYHGTLHARTQGDVFHLNVILPVRE